MAGRRAPRQPDPTTSACFLIRDGISSLSCSRKLSVAAKPSPFIERKAGDRLSIEANVWIS